MSRATPQTRKLSERLVAIETRGKMSPGLKASGAFCVCERLRPYLATLMGNTGFNALLSRALAVANVDDAWLRTLKIEADGSLGELNEPEGPVAPAKMSEGSVVLVSQLLGLLVAFVGETLTLRMVGELWPQLAPTDVHLEKRRQI